MATVLQFTARPTVQPRLRRLRQAQHMRGVELANTFGVDKATVGRWERGPKRIPPRVRSTLAELFGVSEDYLMGRE